MNGFHPTSGGVKPATTPVNSNVQINPTDSIADNDSQADVDETDPSLLLVQGIADSLDRIADSL